MSGQLISQESGQIYPGGQSQKVTLSTTSAQSTALTCKSLVLCADVACFIRRGSNPTALADGTDQYVPANAMLRFVGFQPNQKIAGIAASAGNLYITPEY